MLLAPTETIIHCMQSGSYSQLTYIDHIYGLLERFSLKPLDYIGSKTKAHADTDTSVYMGLVPDT